MANNTVTANILPLAFNMVPNEATEKVFINIVNKIEDENKGHISTGVIGTQWIMRWLTKYGRPDLAYRLASNTSYPSWGYMVEHGATTIWELWNGNTANPSMNSQNHVMLLGDLLVWMYENIGGISSDENDVAFKKIIMKPSFEVDLSFANTSYDSPYGKIISSWKKENGKLKWDITVPANTHAMVYVPAESKADVWEGAKLASASVGVQFCENGKWKGRFRNWRRQLFIHHSIETNRNHVLPHRGKRWVAQNSNKQMQIIKISFLIIVQLTSLLQVVAQKPWKKGILVDEFIYDTASYPECHASTIAETPAGLVAAWFGGTKERNPDVEIWLSRMENKKWTKGVSVANGIVNDKLRYPCWNPVLFQVPGGDLLLFYKIGPSPSTWKGWMKSSTDNGKTWSAAKALPEGFIGPVKNKPVLLSNGVLLSGIQH
jgi:alpha-L-rhamnosidase